MNNNTFSSLRRQYGRHKYSRRGQQVLRLFFSSSTLNVPDHLFSRPGYRYEHPICPSPSRAQNGDIFYMPPRHGICGPTQSGATSGVPPGLPSMERSGARDTATMELVRSQTRCRRRITAKTDTSPFPGGALVASVQKCTVVGQVVIYALRWSEPHEPYCDSRTSSSASSNFSLGSHALCGSGSYNGIALQIILP